MITDLWSWSEVYEVKNWRFGVTHVRISTSGRAKRHSAHRLQLVTLLLCLLDCLSLVHAFLHSFNPIAVHSAMNSQVHWEWMNEWMNSFNNYLLSTYYIQGMLLMPRARWILSLHSLSPSLLPWLLWLRLKMQFHCSSVNPFLVLTVWTVGHWGNDPMKIL